MLFCNLNCEFAIFLNLNISTYIIPSTDEAKYNYLEFLPIYVETNPDFPAIVISPQCPEAPVKITVYTDADHDSWTETYANPKMYEWLFAQTKKK